MEFKSVFYPTEMDLYDAFISNHQKVTNNYLITLLRDKGILVSNDCSREFLVGYVSQLNFDYLEFKNISNYLTPSSRSEKTTSEIIETEINDDEILQGFDNLKEARGSHNENYNIVLLEGANTTRIEIFYEEVDHSKTRVIQKVTKEGFIDIVKTDKGIKIRHTSNDRVARIKDSFIKQIAENKDDKIEPIRISFSGIADLKYQTIFFTSLLKYIKGLTPETVVKISLSRDDITPLDLDIDDAEKEDLEDNMRQCIRKARFDGESLLETDIYQELKQKGYYLTSMRWISLENLNNPRKFEFEASFVDRGYAIVFEYSLKGVYNFKKEKYTNLITKIPEDEKKNLISRFETAANQVYTKIINEIKELKNDNKNI